MMKIIETSTFPQSQVLYSDNASGVGQEGMAVEASAQANTYTKNNLEVWYYESLLYMPTNVLGALSNQEKPIFT